MKKWSVLVLAMALGLWGCGNSPREIIKIGIATADTDHNWSAAVASCAEEYCRENQIGYQTAVFSDSTELAAGLRQLAEDGCTAVITCLQWTGMEAALRETVDGGIPVVSFGVDTACQGVYKVLGDNHAMGYRCAEYITGVAGDAAHIVVLDVPAVSACGLRKDGFYDWLEETGYDGTNIVEYQLDAFSCAAGQTAMAAILEADPWVDAVFAMDDETAMGAVQAIREAGRTDIRAITGGGGCQAYLHMIVDEQYEDLGLATALYSPAAVTEAVKTAAALSKGQTADPVILLPTAIINKDNAAGYLDEGNTTY